MRKADKEVFETLQRQVHEARRVTFKQMQNDDDHAHFAESIAENERATTALDLHVAQLANQVRMLQQQLLTHHESVAIEDGGARQVTKLDIYRGKTPDGKTLTPIRDASALRTQWHAEQPGAWVSDEEMRGMREAGS